MQGFEFEKKYKKLLCGVDEAGRGPLCGPVFAAAVILPHDFDFSLIDDSKKLSEKKRSTAFKIIKSKAVSYCIAFATSEEIDAYNILNATFLAMSRAISGLSQRPELALIDGNRAKNMPVEYECVIKGDSLCPSIAAASVLAKVARDRYMELLDKRYPEYKIKKHKGYPTALHFELIRENGVAPIYRRSFFGKHLELLGKTYGER